MLKKIITAAIIIAVVLLGSAGYIYAYQKEVVAHNSLEENLSSNNVEHGPNEFNLKHDCEKESQNDCECLNYGHSYKYNYNFQKDEEGSCECENSLQNDKSEHYQHNYGLKNEGADNSIRHGQGREKTSDK